MDFLDSFPLLVVEMVFSHLKKAEILKLTLVSPKTNAIISNSAHLMANIRFKIEGDESEPGTRKYSRIDFFNLRHPNFQDLPVAVTEITFDDCRIDGVTTLLSKVSSTLELLIISNCAFKDHTLCFGCKNCFKEKSNLEDLLFPNFTYYSLLQTLIIVDVTGRSLFKLLSIIKTSNLIELGLIKILSMEKLLERPAAEMFIYLIKINPMIKNLHVPTFATRIFLDNALRHTESRFVQLSFAIEFDNEDLDHSYQDPILNFLEWQKETLRYLRLEGCSFQRRHTERLLALNLVRLELQLCKMKLPPYRKIQNATIQSLTVMHADDTENETILQFVKSCSNLKACIAFLTPTQGLNFSETAKEWKCMDHNEVRPKILPWAELRSLQFAGVAFLMQFYSINRCYHFFQDGEVSVETHPCSVIEFVKKPDSKHLVELTLD